MTALRAEGCGIVAFGGDEYIVSVTGFTLVATMLHDEEPELPSSGRGGWRRRRGRIGTSLKKGFRGEGVQPLRGWRLWPPAAAGCIERLCSLPLKEKVAAPPQFIAPFPRKGGRRRRRRNSVSSFQNLSVFLNPIGQLHSGRASKRKALLWAG